MINKWCIKQPKHNQKISLNKKFLNFETTNDLNQDTGLVSGVYQTYHKIKQRYNITEKGETNCPLSRPPPASPPFFIRSWL